MTKEAKALFVRLWKAELAASTQKLKAENDLGVAEWSAKPIKALKTKVKNLKAKCNEISKEIEGHVLSGLFPADADMICAERLGDMRGYVADCYHDLCEDCRFVIKCEGE
ncbi:MAG: hypothetical protein ACRCVX_16950 [Shewanella sp.]